MSQSSNKSSQWFACYHPRPEAKLRLIGFPHGGGGPQAFREWGQLLSDDIEVVAVSLPGRTPRLDEPLITSMDELVPQVVERLTTYFDKPFVFFGHSMGAAVAFEVTRVLTELGYPLPLHLFVSAHKAPHLVSEGIAIHRLSDGEILAHIRQLGLVPAQLLDHEELVEQILTPLRADDALLERYLWDKEQPVTVALTALGGRDDVTLPEAQIAAWHSCTSASFTMRMFEGGHFYTESKQEAVTTFITQTIQATIAALPKSILHGESAPYPEKCLHELFREQAAKTPDALAIAYEQTQLTFGELDQQSDLLARYLQSRGVRCQLANPLDSFVGIYMENSVAYVVAYIAALKAGGAYMPIDVAYPDELLERVLETAKPVVVLTNERFYARLSEGWQARAFQMDVEWTSMDDVVVPENLPEPTIDNLAYCVMSSGTTGTPKGIICPHRGAVNSYYWRYVRYLYQEDDCEACNLFFVWEVLRPLLKGVPAYVIPGEVIYDPPRLVDFLYKHRITRMMFTASLLEQVLNLPEVELKEKLRYLRIIYLSGEVVTTALRNRFLDLFPHVTLLNDYSISECHDVCHYDLAESNPIYTPKYTSVGPAMDNVSVYLLDENQALVPVGFKGEIYVGGDSMGHGYLDAEMTAERFFRDPFANDGSIMFRTGDSGRILPNGHLEIQGRIAFMIKLRGYSIVPTSVESAMMEHPAVNAAVVITQDNEETGQAEYLLGYVVLTMPDERLISDLRGYLKQKLPHYAIPAYIIPLDELPVGVTGKLDRRNLPKPQEAMTRLKGTQISAPPKSQTEKVLAQVWESVLQIGSVERTDNFFDLGGHSLLATQIVSQIRDAFQVELPISRIFETPTLAGLAESIEAETAHTAHKQEPQLPPLRPASREGVLPLSFAQESLWFLDKLFEDSFVYTSSEVIGLPSDFERSWLVPIFNEIVRRHEVLRTNIVMVDGRPTQVIQPPYQVVIKQPDFSTCAEGEDSIEALIKEHAQQPFDLAEGPMLQLQLLEIESDSFSLQLTLPHLIFDGWSLNIILQEFCALYEAFSNGQPSPLPDLPVQLADFALWERAWLSDEVLEPQITYWKEQLAAPLPILALPTDYARPPMQTFDGRHQRLAFPAHLLSPLQALSQEEGVTLFMTLLAAFDVLLYRYTDQEDIVVGSTIVNRNRAELEHLVGFFTNTIVLRSDLSGSPSFRTLLKRVKKVCLDAYTHQALPFERLVDILQPERDLSYPPLFQVMFLLLDYDYLTGELPINLSVHDVDNETSKFDLTLCLFEGQEGLTGYWEYSTDLFDAATMTRMTSHFQTLLESIVSNPEQSIGSLSMMTQAEQNQLLIEWNDTAKTYACDKSIHQLFEAHAAAERTPDAIALVYEQQQLTYRELNARANQLAHHLIGLGVGNEQLVGICLERSFEMVVGLLAILKAGGAYLPLDPNYPAERLSFMLADAEVSLLLTSDSLMTSLPETTAELIYLDRDWGTQRKVDRTLSANANPPKVVRPDNLAYVMFTSGSTGQPKGTMITHQNVVRLVRETNYINLDETEIFLQLAPLSFDASTLEIWAPLLNGGCLVIMPPGRPSLVDIGAHIHRYGVTTLWLTAGLFHLMVDEYLEELKPLRQLLAGGDVLSVSHVKKAAQALPDTQLINGYGPTENTTFTCCHKVSNPEQIGRSVPIGRPIANTQVYILNESLQPVPIGIAGQLCTAGAGLGRGYLNRPKLTASKFIPNPFGPGQLYKSGDMARWLPDGTIEFLGRIDHQVKIRGFRIELGEIEAVLSQHPIIQEAVVIARLDSNGQRRLVAYVTTIAARSRRDVLPFTQSEWRDYLKQKLPDYMIPSAFVLLDALPLTANGKIDRNALPEPELSAKATTSRFMPPKNPTEKRLARLWAEVLGLSPASGLSTLIGMEQLIGRDDNFFELGGHSLSVIELLSRVKTQFGQKIPVATFFQSPSIAQLGALLSQNNSRAALSSSVVIPIQPKGDQRPLFCLPGAGSHVFTLQHLAQALGTSQPFYGLQPPGLEAETLPVNRMSELVSLFEGALLDMGHQGPIDLGGHSAGGVIAFALALALQKPCPDEGRSRISVPRLAIFDSVPPRSAQISGDYPSLLATLAWRVDERQALLDLIQIMSQALGTEFPYSAQESKLLAKDTLSECLIDLLQHNSSLSREHAVTHLQRIVSSYREMGTVLQTYTPDTTYQGQLVLFLATDSQWKEADWFVAGWQALCEQPIEVHLVPGNHITFLQPPYVTQVADLLRASRTD